MNELLDLRSKQWTLLILPHLFRDRLLIAAARLAERGPVSVFDCGRQFDASIVARAARGRTEIIDRIHVQRAFICFEVAKLLMQKPANHGPVLILDMLSTFYDENLQIHTRKFLLEGCLLNLERLSAGAGLAVTVSLPPKSSDSFPLFERLQSAAPQVLTYAMPAPESQQLSLF